MTMTVNRCLLAMVQATALAACSGELGRPGGADTPLGGPAPSLVTVAGSAAVSGMAAPAQVEAIKLPAATLRRLTLSQYENSVRDLLGLAPDTANLTELPPLNGLRAIGASTLSLPQRDVEAFDSLATTLSDQVFSAAALRQQLVGCDALQTACAERFVGSFGRRVFRRPLTAEENARYLGLLRGATALGDGWLGLRVVSSALMQSPAFLYREELGAPDPSDPTRRVLSGYELASRLSYFLWNTTPDAALLDAAASGKLGRADGLMGEVRRLLDSPRAAAAIEELFSDYLQLDVLDALVKLPEAFPQSTPTLAAAMKQETLSTLRTLLFERGEDFRNMFTTTTTFANAELAELYGIRAASGAGFAEIMLPGNGPRAGVLMHASFLAGHSHPGRSSPTLRGKFIRQNILCQAIPAPPNNVDTSLPSNTRDGQTARQRLTKHREDPSCAGCHSLMDPIGLALEKFDGIGAFRERENGLAIDTSGDLDGQAFADARGLAAALAADPGTATCFTRTLLRYARGALENASEAALIDRLDDRFAGAGHRLTELMLAIATDASFQQVGAIE